MPKKSEKTATKKPVPAVPTDYKILQELKNANDILEKIKDILDNMWRERQPQ